jgi:hypothetical protein
MKMVAKRPGEFTNDDPMWVIGCIDSYGAIVGRAATSVENIMHGAAESKGKRWRWNIWGQDWCDTRNHDQLTDEEFLLVVDWLERKGYKWVE